MKQFKKLFCSILAASLLAGSASPMSWAQGQYAAHPMAAKGIGGTAAALAALYLANRIMNGKIDKAVSKNAEELRHRWEQLDNLEARFANTPFENFRQVADEKIAGLVDRLDAHTATKIALLNAEFDKVVAERRRVELELQQSRDLLRQVEVFMQSVRDRNGDAFLRQIIQTKQEIEDSYLRLQRTKNQLDQELTNLSARAAVQTGELGRVEGRTDQLRNNMQTLERFVQAQEGLASKTRQAESRAAELVRKTKEVDRKMSDANALGSSFDRLRGEAEKLDRKAREVQRRLDAVPNPSAKAVPCAPPSINSSSAPSAPEWPSNNSPAPSAPEWPSNDTKN